MNTASFVSLVKNPTSAGGGREILKKAADLSNGRWPGGIQNMHKPWPQKRDYSDIAIQVMTVLWNFTSRCLERLESPKSSWVHSCDQNSKFKLQVTSDTATHPMVFQQDGKHWWRPEMSDEAWWLDCLQSAMDVFQEAKSSLARINIMIIISATWDSFRDLLKLVGSRSFLVLESSCWCLAA